MKKVNNRNIYQEFAIHLQKQGFTGDILSTSGQRLMYASDNSLYQQNPQLIVQPKHRDDLILIQKLIVQEKWREITVTPFGGGTGTNGQALNDGLVVDNKRYMNAIEELDVKNGWVRVGAGITLSQLNSALQPHGQFFAPEVSPADRATIGGMVATDASGKGSKVYGKTSAHLFDAEIILPGGEIINCKHQEKPSEKANKLISLINRINLQHRKEIEAIFPAITREATGYNLSRAINHPNLALHYLFAGSEGTLGIFSSLTLKLTPLPKHHKMLVVGYPNFTAALASVKNLTNLPILAIETFDETLFNLARGDSSWQVVKHVFANAQIAESDNNTSDTNNNHVIACCNMIEVVADSSEELADKVSQVSANLSANDNWFEVISDEKTIKAMWNLRSRGVGILGNLPGNRQPQAFIEDCAVSAERLADFVADFKQILQPYSLTYAFYGHVDVGCLHLRPALDLNDNADRDIWKKLTHQAMLLCKQYGGVFWGEHGKGWRGGLAIDYFGETLYQVMCEIKAICDPYNQMNPGKIATPNGELPIAFDAPQLRSDYNRQITLANQEKFSQALRCNGNTVCLGYSANNVMCPSYKASLDLRQSPKGRANLLREWVRRQENNQNTSEFTKEVSEAMHSCLGCKACAGTCPVQVSIPELKSRFFAELKNLGGSFSLRDSLLTSSELFANLGSKFSRSANLLGNNIFAKKIFNQLGFYDLPTWKKNNIFNDYPRADVKVLSRDNHPQKVVLIIDAFLNGYDPEPLAAGAQLLTKAGAKVYITPAINSGKADYSLGNRPKAQKQMEANSKYLLPLTQHADLVAIEPSISLFFQQEYQDNNIKVEVNFLHQWLLAKLEQQDLTLPKIKSDLEVSIFAHCSEQSTLPQAKIAWQKLFELLGIKCHLPQTGCCGMAGWYGHLIEYRNYSKKLFESSWQEQIKTAQSKGLVLVTGYSCRHQSHRFCDEQFPHPLIELNNLI